MKLSKMRMAIKQKNAREIRAATKIVSKSYEL